MQRTKNTCQQEALKYQTKREFRTNNRNAYTCAYNHGYLDEICKHMISLGDRKHKCVYCCEFPDNHVYIGITFDFNRRKKDREKRANDTVTRYINNTELVPIHKQLTDYIKEEEAVLLEAEFVKEYKNHNWIVLNKVKTGGVGGDILYWTHDKCIEEALKYNTKSDFNLHSKGAYDSCRRNGWLNEAYSHMKPFNRKDLNLYWTKEYCISKALLCDTRTEFRKKYGGAYDSARRHKWLDEIYLYIITLPKKIITFEDCKQEALKYDTKYDFRHNSNKIYELTRKNKWLNKCCQHMIKRKIIYSNGYGNRRKWTEQKCLESALKCESFVEWRTKDKGAYKAAQKYKWFENCVKHMKRYK